MGTDSFTGRGQHTIVLPFHFAPGVELITTAEGIEILAKTNSHRWLFRVQSGKIEVGEAEVAPAYGVRVRAPLVRVVSRSALPHTITYSIETIGI